MARTTLRWILWFTQKSLQKKSPNLPRKEQQKRQETTRSSTAVACFAPFEKRSVIIWEWGFEGILRPICREKGHSCGMAGWRIAANLAKYQLGPSHSFSLGQNLSFLLCFRCNLENHSFWSGLEEIYAKWDSIFYLLCDVTLIILFVAATSCLHCNGWYIRVEMPPQILFK